MADAQAAQSRLRQGGIITHLSSKKSFGLGGHATGVFQVSLWAVVNAQYEDALMLLDDPKHQVAHPLSQVDVSKLEASAKVRLENYVLKLAENIFTVSLFLFLVGGIAYVAYVYLTRA